MIRNTTILFSLFFTAWTLNGEHNFVFKDEPVHSALEAVLGDYNLNRTDGPMMYIFISSSFDFEKRVSISLKGVTGRRAIELVAQAGGAFVVFKDNYSFIFNHAGIIEIKGELLPGLKVVNR